MTRVLVISFVLLFHGIRAQPSLETDVYRWNPAGRMFSGSGDVLREQTLSGHVMNPGGRYRLQSSDNGPDRLLIVREGMLQVGIGDSSRLLDASSAAFLPSGDDLRVSNPGPDTACFYVLTMVSASPDRSRGSTAGGAFAIHSAQMRYRAHDRGGVRQLFDRPTVHLSRFDIHITTLNPRLSSHAPHTHRNEEIILMLDGEGEMVHGDHRRRIVSGEAAWVGSMVPHNITNTGNRPAVYYAIQWN
jgi:(S)-ureidoglycine aminohydrolase